MLVEGPAGIGKSALVQRFLTGGRQRARRSGERRDRLSQAASVLGQCAPVDLARRLAGIGEPTAVVEESTTCELLDLVATTHTREVAFPSPSARHRFDDRRGRAN